MTTQDQTARLRDVLAAIAAHLDGWRIETPWDHGAQLVHDTGARIYCRTGIYDPWPFRITLTAGGPDGASYPDGDYRGLDAPSITINAGRAPETLARDIGRRIAPQAIDYFGEVSLRMGRRIANRNAQADRARELAKVMGGTAREWRDAWQADVPQTASGRLYGELSPDYGGETVRAELRGMTAAQARELAKLIGRWK